MKRKLTLLQRVVKALFPPRRAPAKESNQTCSECRQQFLGTKRELTCSKACKRDRRERLLAERWKPVDSPLVNAIHDADPDIRVTVSEFK